MTSQAMMAWERHSIMRLHQLHHQYVQHRAELTHSTHPALIVHVCRDPSRSALWLPLGYTDDNSYAALAFRGRTGFKVSMGITAFSTPAEHRYQEHRQHKRGIDCVVWTESGKMITAEVLGPKACLSIINRLAAKVREKAAAAASAATAVEAAASTFKIALAVIHAAADTDMAAAAVSSAQAAATAATHQHAAHVKAAATARDRAEYYSKIVTIAAASIELDAVISASSAGKGAVPSTAAAAAAAARIFDNPHWNPKAPAKAHRDCGKAVARNSRVAAVAAQQIHTYSTTIPAGSSSSSTIAPRSASAATSAVPVLRTTEGQQPCEILEGPRLEHAASTVIQATAAAQAAAVGSQVIAATVRHAAALAAQQVDQITAAPTAARGSAALQHAADPGFVCFNSRDNGNGGQAGPAKQRGRDGKPANVSRPCGEGLWKLARSKLTHGIKQLICDNQHKPRSVGQLHRWHAAATTAAAKQARTIDLRQQKRRDVLAELNKPEVNLKAFLAAYFAA